MKQIIEELRTGTVRVVESPAPTCGPDSILIRNAASLISPGTEKLMIQMGRKSLAGKALARPDLVRLALGKAKREGFIRVFRESLSRLDEPVPLGYSSSGTVVAAGRNVKGFGKGDAVACAGHATASHAELIVAPPDLCVKHPRSSSGDALSHEEAAFIMLGGIALQGIRTAGLTPGERVVVIGLGLIGLLTVQIAAQYGCQVIGLDVNSGRVELARRLGCRRAFRLSRRFDAETSVQNLTEGHGGDAVLITAATSDNAPVLLAENICRQRGRIVLVGVSEISLTRKTFWEKELTFTVSKASGPSPLYNPRYRGVPIDAVRWTEHRNLEEFMRLLASRLVDVRPLITHRYALESATDAYRMILRGREAFIGVVIQYPGRDTSGPIVVLKNADGKESETVRGGERRTVGVIGAGLFTKNILLPALRRQRSIRFAGIATKSGLTGRHVGERYGFSYATTEYQRLLEDPQIGSIVVGTRHNLHAQMVIDGWKAGKNVFVEKPLCIDPRQLRTLQKESLHLRQAFMVGFNRRFSLLARILRDSLAGRTAPLQAHYRVNAGFIPPDHWTQDPNEGGGRIIGEVCHFVDFLQYLSGSDPEEVFAESLKGDGGKYVPDDNVQLAIQFADGSVGSVLYTALGPKTFSRERVEVFWGESAAVLQDFRTLEIRTAADSRRKRLWNQDMGFEKELEAFFDESPEQGRLCFRDAAITTAATFAAVESLRTRMPVSVRSYLTSR